MLLTRADVAAASSPLRDGFVLGGVTHVALAGCDAVGPGGSCGLFWCALSGCAGAVVAERRAVPWNQAIRQPGNVKVMMRSSGLEGLGGVSAQPANPLRSVFNAPGDPPPLHKLGWKGYPSPSAWLYGNAPVLPADNFLVDE